MTNELKDLRKELVTISNEDIEIRVNAETITAITEYTNDIAETSMLLLYLKQRTEAYNDNADVLKGTLLHHGKFNCSARFMQELFTSLLRDTYDDREYISHDAYTAQQICNALEQLSDQELFGKVEYDDEDDVFERVCSITEKVNAIIHNEDSMESLDNDTESLTNNKRLLAQWEF